MLHLCYVCEVRESLENDAAMQEFIGYLMTERGYSEKTKEAYQRDLNDFCQFLENSGESSLLAVDHLDVRVYLAFLNGPAKSCVVRGSLRIRSSGE